MKKALSLFMAAFLLLSFVACGGGDTPTGETTAAPGVSDTTEPTTTEQTTPSPADNNPLVGTWKGETDFGSNNIIRFEVEFRSDDTGVMKNLSANENSEFTYIFDGTNIEWAFAESGDKSGGTLKDGKVLFPKIFNGYDLELSKPAAPAPDSDNPLLGIWKGSAPNSIGDIVEYKAEFKSDNTGRITWFYNVQGALGFTYTLDGKNINLIESRRGEKIVLTFADDKILMPDEFDAKDLKLTKEP